jgi:hypothetical protein
MNETFRKLRQEKERLIRQEQIFIRERKEQVAWYAEQYGLLTLQDEELCRAFEKIAATHR